jgi:hypothetical protein
MPSTFEMRRYILAGLRVWPKTVTSQSNISKTPSIPYIPGSPTWWVLLTNFHQEIVAGHRA